MSRHYYAVWHPYGLGMSSAGDTLYRFNSAAERRESVDSANFVDAGAHGHYRTIEVTRDEARRDFPEAFRPESVEWDNWRQGDAEMCGAWWRLGCDADEWTGRPTGGRYQHI